MECPQIIQVAAAGCALNCIIHFMNYLPSTSSCFMHVHIHFIYFFVCLIQSEVLHSCEKALGNKLHLNLMLKSRAMVVD